jgi:hypothetical protein
MRPRPYASSDEDAVLELLARSFGEPREREHWRWQVSGPPSGSSRSMVLERERDDAGAREIVGHAGIHGFASFVDTKTSEVALMSDLAVSASNGYAGFARLVRGSVESLGAEGVPVIGFPVEMMLRISRREPGFRPHARLPQWIRWLRPAGLRASRPTPGGRLLAPVVPAALAARARFGGRGVRVKPLGELGAEVDALAGESAGYARCIRVRDADYLRWRWLEQPGSSWSVLAARGGDGSLRGIAVVGQDPGSEHGGAPVGRIVDLLAGDRGATTALLRAAAGALRAAGCAIATFDYLDPRPWSGSACRRAGFLERGVGPSMITGRTGVSEDHPAGSRESWYLTRGDSDLA